MGQIVYFSSRSENTHRFIQRLGLANQRLPEGSQQAPEMREPYVLVTPTYGGGGNKGAVPKPVIHFLNRPENRSLLRGVIAAGNSNFGRAFGLAGTIISQKCQVPYLYRFELLGTDEDVNAVKHGMERFWTQQH